MTRINAIEVRNCVIPDGAKWSSGILKLIAFNIYLMES